MEHAAKISLINGLAAVITMVCYCTGYYWAFAIDVICCLIMCFYWHTFFLLQVIVISQFLGAIFTAGFILTFFSVSFVSLGLYMMAMGAFHFSEFHMIAAYNPSTLSFASFVLTSKYCIMTPITWVEYWLEYSYYPDIKAFGLVFSLGGVMLVVVGELLRKITIRTAGMSFSHIIAREKTQNHKLVTTGLFHWFRHPSYVGLMCWCVGTQMLLCNPITIIIIPLVLWRFFKKRVYEEEERLIAFYGQQYIEYKKRVGTGLFGIHGYPIEKDN